MKTLSLISKIILSILVIPIYLLMFPLIFIIMLVVVTVLEGGGWRNINITEFFVIMKNGFIESYRNLTNY